MYRMMNVLSRTSFGDLNEPQYQKSINLSYVKFDKQLSCNLQSSPLMNVPNFFLVGAGKSGTTSLYHYLNQHPEIFMCPEREPSFFIFNRETPQFCDPKNVISETFTQKLNKVTGLSYEAYLSLFDGAGDAKVIGEASPDYLFHPVTPSAIHQASPKAKILAILRNPFDTCYSNYLMKKRDGYWVQGKSFLEVLQSEDIDVKNIWSVPDIIRRGFYDLQVENYKSVFPEQQRCFFLFEDLKEPQKLMESIFEFLEVSTSFKPDLSEKHNTKSAIETTSNIHKLASLLPQNLKQQIKSLIPSALKMWYLQKRLGIETGNHKLSSKCPDEEQEFLRPIYTPRILRLQELLDRDLSHWLK